MRFTPLLPALTFMLLGALCSAQDADARAALERFQALRPGPDELGMYRLDWASNLEVALERARAERRPVCLVVIHARYGDIQSGHC